MTTFSQTAAINASRTAPESRASIHTNVSPRRLAIVAGVCFLITHVTSIAAPALNGLATSSAVSSVGSDSQVIVAAILEVILAIANIGTAVALYPVVRRWSDGGALAYVGLRTLEAAVIAVGVLPLLTLVTLRQAGAADTAVADALVVIHKWTLLVGPGLVCATNTVVMASLLFASRLVPRFIPVLGLVGGPLIFVFTLVRMFNGFDSLPPVAAIAVLPIFVWEVSLALWLITRGFRQQALAALPATAVR
jgi:hypothetical protein